MAVRYPVRNQDRDPRDPEFRETLAPAAPGQPARTYRSEPVVETRPTVFEQIIQTVAVILLALLGLRFILALFGANAHNAFVSFVFSATDWMVQPFRSVFAMPATGAGGYFDWASLLAFAVIAVLATIVLRLLRAAR